MLFFLIWFSMGILGFWLTKEAFVHDFDVMYVWQALLWSLGILLGPAFLVFGIFIFLSQVGIDQLPWPLTILNFPIFKKRKGD